MKNKNKPKNILKMLSYENKFACELTIPEDTIDGRYNFAVQTAKAVSEGRVSIVEAVMVGVAIGKTLATEFDSPKKSRVKKPLA